MLPSLPLSLYLSLSGSPSPRKALSSLGKGFDLSSDFCLKYCKGDHNLIVLKESDTRDLWLPGFGIFARVSVDVKCDKGERTRYQTDILDFKQMSEFFNQKTSVPGKIPSGLFNSMFGFQSGSWSLKVVIIDLFEVLASLRGKFSTSNNPSITFANYRGGCNQFRLYC